VANGCYWASRVVAGIRLSSLVNILVFFSEPPDNLNLIHYADPCTRAIGGAFLDQ
jgi:hypothetical protein